jgi:hypothetical protein
VSRPGQPEDGSPITSDCALPRSNVHVAIDRCEHSPPDI